MPEIKKYLSRDGLEEYNSLLPHSSGEMQEYVNDWLDEHPEATTTVQDGAITEPKLADKSVSLRTLADDTVHMLKGAILTGNLSGSVLTADDAYSAPPVALTVEGKSTQDGTPTPDAPVEIVSLEQANLTFAGRNLLPNDRFCAGNYNRPAGHTFNPDAPTSATLVDNGDGTFTMNVTAGWGGLSLYTAPLPAGTYHLHFGFSGSTPRVAFGYVDPDTMTYVSQTENYTSSDTIDKSITLSATRIIVFSVQSSDGTAITITQPQVEAGSTATDYQPYNGTNVLLNLTHALRSLPNGTHDTLSLTYLRPSTREGWAWYTPTLTQKVGSVVIPENPSLGELVQYGDYVRASWYGNLPRAASTNSGLCSNAPYTIDSTGQFEHVYVVGASALLFAMGTDYDVIRAAYIGAEIIYSLETPNTTTLDPIELPVLPAPDVTVWSDPSTGLRMEYVRDANIVIQRIEQAIADL